MSNTISICSSSRQSHHFDDLIKVILETEMLLILNYFHLHGSWPSQNYFVLVKILFQNSHKVSCLVLRKLTARLMLHFIGSTWRFFAASSNLRQLKWLDVIIGSRACLRIALNRSRLRTLRLQMLLPTLQSGLSEGSIHICFVASKLFIPSRE